MSLKTTVIGSYPKPGYFDAPFWVQEGQRVRSYVIDEYKDIIDNEGKREDGGNGLREKVHRATKEVIQKQLDLGIDVITNGEIGRENYIYTFCRKIQGFDFDNKVWIDIRNGASRMEGVEAKRPVRPGQGEPFLVQEWNIFRDITLPPGKRIKVTAPGPVTISDSTSKGSVYSTREEFCADLAKCINHEILSLVNAGCSHIQIDEPVLVRFPEFALNHGIKYLKQCFDGVPDYVTKTVHICCGYPHHLDQIDYQKADQDAYFKLASALDQAGFDEISIEDAHRRNDPKLFGHFKKTKIVLGVIDIASSRIESVEEIKEHISEVMEYIPKDRLVIAPDCGLIFLNDELITKKIGNMVEAARTF